MAEHDFMIIREIFQCDQSNTSTIMCIFFKKPTLFHTGMYNS